MEKKGILGNTTGRRPDDVTFPRWAGGKSLAIDVAVTSCLAPTYVRLPEPCEWYAATQKHGKYSTSFQGTEYIFSAMVFETLGAVNAEGEELLRQLFHFAAPSDLGASLPRIAVEHGHVFRAICSGLWR